MMSEQKKTCAGQCTGAIVDDLETPTGKWESTLWRALISVSLLVASWVVGRTYAPSDGLAVVGSISVVSAIIALIAALVAVIPLLKDGFVGLFSDEPGATLDQLAGIAVLAAMVRGDFTTAVIVGLALSLGHLAEERGIRRAGAAIESLVKLSTRTAHRRMDSGEEDIPSDQLVKDDVVVVYPGEVVPADGEVISGHSAIDPAHLTGESTPIDVGGGSNVYHGSINLTGRIEVRVEKTSSETSLGRVIDALGRAETSRPPVVRTLEQYAGMLLPVVLLIAASVFVITRDASRAIAVLIVACPCALVLSSPAAMVPALAVAVRNGILIKSGAFLEKAVNIGTLILDKTGTITLGMLAVQEYVPVDGVSTSELESYARVAASGSRHPVSRAISGNNVENTGCDTEEIPGKGVSAFLNGSEIRLGRLDWVTKGTGVVSGELTERDSTYPGTSTWVGKDGRLIGLVLLSDQPRPEVTEALEGMKKLGINRRVLVTGDREEVARAVGEKIAFDRIEAGLLPESKDDIVEEEIKALRDRGGGGVMFVGDGVNDALALNRADVGVAMGAMGSEVALQSADIALMTNDLMLIPFLVKLSRRVHATIRTNIYGGVGFSVFMLLLAMVGIITPIWGAILHHGGTLFVIGNSMRLLNEEK